MAIDLKKSPVLPIAPQEYTASRFGDILSVLRLYFNYLDSVLFQIGGLSYARFTHDADQTLPGADTATAILFNTDGDLSGISVENDGSSNPTQVTVSQQGYYRIEPQLQLTNTAAVPKEVQVWLAKNGTAIAGTNTYTTLTADAEKVMYCAKHVVLLEEDDYVQVMWASDSTAVSIDTIAATAYSPATTSAALTIIQERF